MNFSQVKQVPAKNTVPIDFLIEAFFFFLKKKIPFNSSMTEAVIILSYRN